MSKCLVFNPVIFSYNNSFDTKNITHKKGEHSEQMNPSGQLYKTAYHIKRPYFVLLGGGGLAEYRVIWKEHNKLFLLGSKNVNPVLCNPSNHQSCLIRGSPSLEQKQTNEAVRTVNLPLEILYDQFWC